MKVARKATETTANPVPHLNWPHSGMAKEGCARECSCAQGCLFAETLKMKHGAGSALHALGFAQLRLTAVPYG